MDICGGSFHVFVMEREGKYIAELVEEGFVIYDPSV